MEVKHARDLCAKNHPAETSEKAKPERDAFRAGADVRDEDDRNKLLDVEEYTAEQEADRLYFDDTTKLGTATLAPRRVAGHMSRRRSCGGRGHKVES